MKSNESGEKTTIFQGKSNQLLFVIGAIWQVIIFSIGVLLSTGSLILFLSGVFGSKRNANHTIIMMGFIVMALIIIIKIVHIIWLRRCHFYIVTHDAIVSQGGVLSKYEITLKTKEIRSVSYIQTLIQQMTGCGDIVVSSAATYRSGLLLKNIDNVKSIVEQINQTR